MMEKLPIERRPLTARVSLLLSLSGAVLLAAADAIHLLGDSAAQSVPAWAMLTPEAAIVLLLFGFISFSFSATLTHV